MTVYQICFSPTGGTKKVADYLTHALSEEAISVDLTDSRTDFDKISLTPDDLAIIAVPSYGGRVPAPAVERLAALQGNGAHTVLVCVYGNRAYEDIVRAACQQKQHPCKTNGDQAAEFHSIMPPNAFPVRLRRTDRPVRSQYR